MQQRQGGPFVNKKTIRDIDLEGKRVLMRVDFNVPLDKATREIVDDSRIRAALPTIEALRSRQARTILVSHLGRPDGRVIESARLAPVAARLAELLGIGVPCATDVVGDSARALVADMREGDVVMLENVRFEPGEETNDRAFAERLASLAEIYVNDAFGTAHRAHASTAGVAEFLLAVAGLLMEKEIQYLSGIIEDPEPPVAAIIGGAKISSKISVLQHLLSKVNVLLIGGGMASTFLKAQGVEVGSSLVEDDQSDTALAVIAEASKRGVSLGLPVDAVVGDRFAADAGAKTVDIAHIPQNGMILDVGPATVADYIALLAGARTVVWNGPLGVAEWERFRHGSEAIARFLAESEATVVIGGGETVALVQDLGLADTYAHVSTGGGASLEFLEGKTLPGIAALQDA